MSRKELKVDSVAEAYLALLVDRGVEYLFANAGTDFAPIVEAYARAAHSGLAAPKPLIATHENLAMSMAHGYAAASGRVPAVMVHVSVGTANALCGVMNAARAKCWIGLLIFSNEHRNRWSSKPVAQAGSKRFVWHWIWASTPTT